MFNHSQNVFKVSKGDRVAQLICELILYPEIEEAEV
jgi:dUTP pyrophosphatase